MRIDSTKLGKNYEMHILENGYHAVTIPAEGFAKMVAFRKMGNVTGDWDWIHKNFRKGS